MGKTNNPAVMQARFLREAVSTDKSRYYMGHVYYDADEKRLVATDRHRMHMVDNPVMPGGIPTGYVFIDRTSGFIGPLELKDEFVNYKRVIPEHGDGKSYEMEASDTGIPIFMASKGIALDMEYCKALSGHTWTVTWTETDRAVMFTRTEGEQVYRAVIMPLNVDRD
jgi:hypothetical protein